MGANNFHRELGIYAKQNDTAEANRLLMQELGRILVTNRQDFITLLNESGIQANASMSDSALVNLFVNEIMRNKSLRIGAAFLVNVHNKTMGADGSNAVNDGYVKHCYYVMSSHFNANDDAYSNADAATIGAIAGAVGEGTKLANTVVQGSQAKKTGGLNLLAKKQDARTQLTQSILQQRQSETMAKQSQNEQKAKTTRIVIIASSVIIVGSIIGYLIYKNRKG